MLDNQHPNLLLATVFVCGAAIMVLEMLGFRILAPYFGYSIYVWGNLIGLIMAALSLGYFFGGRIADRYPAPSHLYKIILLSSILLVLVLFSYKTIMHSMMTRFGIMFGSFYSSAIIFGPAMVLLSMVSPFVVKLLSSTPNIGSISGKVYAVSTVGSLFGVYAASFYLIPSVGSHGTLIVCFSMLLIVSILGLASKNKKFAMMSFFLPITYFSNPPAGKDVIYHKDSLYFNIKVVKKGEITTFIRDDRARASLYEKGKILTNDYWDFYSLGPLITPVEKILVLGMGTGTTVRQYLAFFPKVKIDAVELDPEVLKIAENYFGLIKNPRLSVYISDVRPFVAASKETYDFIEIDVFRRPLEIPFYLTTEEFFDSVSKRLNPKGVVIMNVVAAPQTLFMKRLIRTIYSSFPACYTLRYKEHMIIFATPQPTALNELKTKLADNKIPELEWVTKIALENMFDCPLDKEVEPLTDDKSPVELLTYNAVHQGR